jgi:DNA-binding YbaB/EbfC family protein
VSAGGDSCYTIAMFDALKNLGNLGELMRKAGEMKSRMAQMQEELAKKAVSADAGGGMVEATVNGKLELIRLKIDKTRVDLSDTEMVEDLVVAAVHAAQNKALEMSQAEMQKMASEMGLPPGALPGM